jgi:hypothetical protein
MRIFYFILLAFGIALDTNAQTTAKVTPVKSVINTSAPVVDIQKNRVQLYRTIEAKFNSCSGNCKIEKARAKDVIDRLAEFEEQRQFAFAKLKMLGDKKKLDQVDTKFFAQKRGMLHGILPGACLAAIGDKMIIELCMPVLINQ